MFWWSQRNFFLRGAKEHTICQQLFNLSNFNFKVILTCILSPPSGKRLLCSFCCMLVYMDHLQITQQLCHNLSSIVNYLHNMQQDSHYFLLSATIPREIRVLIHKHNGISDNGFDPKLNSPTSSINLSNSSQYS